MGSTTMFILLSLEPSMAKHIRLFITLPATVFYSNIDIPLLRFLAPMTQVLKYDIEQDIKSLTRIFFCQC